MFVYRKCRPPERLEWRGGDARSDQFSFCVSVWECMYGARPFSGETGAELLASMRAGELRTGAKPSGVLAMDPAQRFASVDALRVALGDVSVVRVRRVGAAVAGAAVLGAGMVGANLAGDADSFEPQKESSRVIPHLKVGITSGPEPTAPTKPTDPLSDEEILHQRTPSDTGESFRELLAVLAVIPIEPARTLLAPVGCRAGRPTCAKRAAHRARPHRDIRPGPLAIARQCHAQ